MVFGGTITTSSTKSLPRKAPRDARLELGRHALAPDFSCSMGRRISLSALTRTVQVTRRRVYEIASDRWARSAAREGWRHLGLGAGISALSGNVVASIPQRSLARDSHTPRPFGFLLPRPDWVGLAGDGVEISDTPQGCGASPER
jgi:hypothetical protein